MKSNEKQSAVQVHDWKRIQSSQEIELEGISAVVTRSDKSITAVEFTDAKGRRLRVTSPWSSMEVYVPQDAEKKTVSVISGEVAGLPISDLVDGGKDEFAVLSRVADLEQHGVTNISVESRDEEILF